MNTEVRMEIKVLTEQWRERARRFMEEAERARRPADMVRLTAMASTLEWAAGDLSWVAGSPWMLRLPAVHQDSGNSGG